MADIRNVDLGVCSVTRNGTDLGHTIGGVTISYKPTFHDTKVDKFGETVAEQFLVGEELSAKFDLAEFTLANMLVAVSRGTAVADDSMSIGSVAGKRQSEVAGTWVFHPVVNSATDRNDDFTIYKGSVMGEVAIEHKNDGEKVIPVEVMGLVDENRSDGNLLGFFGDSIS